MELYEEQGLLGVIKEADKADAKILPEEYLRQLGRSLPDIVPRNRTIYEGPSAQIQQLRLDLLHTAKSSVLSPSHGAAALNALCGFLDICSACNSGQWSSLCFCPSTCKDLIHVLLERSENFKPKPARQLLCTLTNTLSKYPNEDAKKLIIKHAVVHCVRSISKQADAKAIKSSLQALEHFISKKIITAANILIEIAGEGAIPHKSADGVNFDYDSAAFRNGVEDFTTHVLTWVRYPDCASTISRFLPCFFNSIDACRDNSPTVTTNLTQPGGNSQFWLGPVRRSLERDIGLLDSFEKHVLPGLLRLSATNREAFLMTLPLVELQQGIVGGQTDADIQLCLLAVKIVDVRARGTEAEDTRVQQLEDLNPTRLGMNLIEHPSPDVRIAAFSLMTFSPMITAPIPADIWTCLQESIPHFHQETNPKTRNEFIALMKPLIYRLGHAAKTFAKLSAIRGEEYQDIPEASEDLMKHIKFARWYQRYLLHELRPTASYQSHITALTLFQFVWQADLRPLLSLVSIQASSTYSRRGNITSDQGLNDLVRPLLDLLLDPFDDVRQSASLRISQLMPPAWRHARRDTRSLTVSSTIDTADLFRAAVKLALDCAEKQLQKTARADHADGVGRLYALYYDTSDEGSRNDKKQQDILNSLLSKLSQETHAAQQILPRAPTSNLLHGHLIALRYIISNANLGVPRLNEVDFDSSQQKDPDSAAMRTLQMQSIYNRILSCCRRVWHAVRDILCFDAPEGRSLDEDEDEEAGNESKDTLSFSWRALKESSLLMHAVIEKASSPECAIASNLREADYGIFGDVIFSQLAELRHRGAFSTVAQTFAAWCVECVKSKNPDVSNLPPQWYKDILACIQQQAGALTRRSAGLPAMITGVLAAYPSGSFFDDAVLDLQAIADAPIVKFAGSSDPKLPQVHALNCLKDIFTDSRFGPSTEGHIEIALGIAISSLENDIWAIRNCGLMLLKALLKRLNGGADTASTRVSSSHRQMSRLAYEKFPILSEQLLKLLDQHCDNVPSSLYAQRVFPALETIERFGIPEVYRNEILRALERHLASPIWSIREKAAKAASMIGRAQDLPNDVRDLTCAGGMNIQNKLHGRLLTLKFLITRMMSKDGELSKDERDQLLPELLNAFPHDQHGDALQRNPCPITVAATLNILQEVAQTLTNHKDVDIQIFLSILKGSLVAKRGTPSSHHPPSDMAYALEHDSISRCLDLLRNVKSSSEAEYQRGASGFGDSGSAEPPIERLALSIAEPCGGPDSSNVKLQLWGFHAAKEIIASQGYTRASAAWIRALLLAGNAYSELSTRLAAVASIDGFFVQLRNSTDSNSEIVPVELLTILYDTLVDDDEDVRNHGASIISSKLSEDISGQLNPSKILALSAPAARHKLLQHLSTKYATSAKLALESVWRLTGLTASIDVVSRIDVLRIAANRGPATMNSEDLQLKSVSVLLERAMQQQNVVFEEEKQNLYLDPVMEAEMWAQTMIHLEIEVWPKGLASTVRDWTEDGLKCLLRALDESNDGSLGLTSKFDVYAMFIQVIMMARTLILASSKCPPGTQTQEDILSLHRITRSLEDLYKGGKGKDLHPLILDSVQRILQEVDEVRVAGVVW